MRGLTLRGTVLAVFLAAPALAYCDSGGGIPAAKPPTYTVYNSFGPGFDGWDWMYNFGWAVRGEAFTEPNMWGVEQAFSFVSPKSGFVTDIWVGMFASPPYPEPDQVTFRLARNPAWSPPTPADVMEQWTLNAFPSWDAWSPPQHLVGGGTSYLEEGHSYWLWASAGETTECGWGMNGGGSYRADLLLPHTLRREGQDWLPVGYETVSAFRVDVVPEPSALTLLAVGTVGLLACAWRRRKRAT
jgi:hypothetical protein